MVYSIQRCVAAKSGYCVTSNIEYKRMCRLNSRSGVQEIEYKKISLIAGKP